MISRCPSCAAEVSDDADKCPSCYWDFKAFKRLPPAGAKINLPASNPPPSLALPQAAPKPEEELRVLNFSDMQETPQPEKVKPAAPAPSPESSFGQGLKADPPFSIPNLSPRVGTQSPPPALGSIPVLPPVQPGQPPKTPFEAPAPASAQVAGLPSAPPPPAPRVEEVAAKKKSIPETQRRKTSAPDAAKREFPLPKLIGAGSVVGLLAMAAIYFITKPEAGTETGSSTPAFPKEVPEQKLGSSLPPLISRNGPPPQEAENTAEAATSTISATAPPELKPMIAPQLRETAASTPIFDSAKSSPTPNRPSAFFAVPPKPAATQIPAKVPAEKLMGERMPGKGKSEVPVVSSWRFEGRAYDLITLEALAQATLIFSDKTGKEAGRTTTSGNGNYRIFLDALADGYRMSVQAQDYSEKYLDEVQPPFSELDLAHRKELAKITAVNRPWIGGDLKTSRNFVAIPKYIPEN